MSKTLFYHTRIMKSFILLLLTECLSILFAHAQVMDSIPFELGKDNRVYIRCRVNDSDTLRFLFDTGATDMVLNPNSPRSNFSISWNEQIINQGATGSNSVLSSSSNTFTIGKTSIKALRFLRISYPADSWDGVVGLSFISRYPIRIDYSTRQIYLYEKESFTPPSPSIRLKVEYELGVPVVPLQVRINGKDYQVRAEIDMGSDRVFDLNTPFVRQHDLEKSQTPFAISEITSSDTNQGKLYNVYFDEVKLGSLSLPRIPGAFSTLTTGVQASDKMDGVFGNNFLQRFHLTLDLQEGYIYLQPNNLLYKPFYDFLIY